MPYNCRKHLLEKELGQTRSDSGGDGTFPAKHEKDDFSLFMILQKRTSRDSHTSLDFSGARSNLDCNVHGIANSWPRFPEGSHGRLAANGPGMATSRELARRKRLSLSGAETPAVSDDSPADHRHAERRSPSTWAAKRLKQEFGTTIILLPFRHLNRCSFRSRREARQSSSPAALDQECCRRSSS